MIAPRDTELDRDNGRKSRLLATKGEGMRDWRCGSSGGHAIRGIGCEEMQ